MICVNCNFDLREITANWDVVREMLPPWMQWMFPQAFESGFQLGESGDWDQFWDKQTEAWQGFGQNVGGILLGSLLQGILAPQFIGGGQNLMAAPLYQQLLGQGAGSFMPGLWQGAGRSLPWLGSYYATFGQSM